jgi:hypothetical protein
MTAPAPTRERAITPSRLWDAGLLLPFVERLPTGPRQYRVKGHDEPHYDVDLDSDEICPCRDAYYRTVRCKHQLVCEILDGDLMVRLAYGQMLLRKEEIEKETRRATRHLRRAQRIQT